MNKYIRKILFKIADITNCGTPDIQKEKSFSAAANLRKELNGVETLKEGEFKTLHDYYKIQYPKDLDIFRDACQSDKYSTKPKDKLFFIDDLHNLRKSNHYLLKKKHFIYLLAIHTAFLMTVHKYFNNKYDEFKDINKGIVFEYGLTSTFVHPWEILRILHIPFDKKLFSDCLGKVMSDMMVDYHFCNIIPRDFMDKFIDDPDLGNPKTPYGKEFKKIAEEEWFQVTKSICTKKI